MAARMYRARASAQNFVGHRDSYEQGYMDGAGDENRKLRLWKALEQGRRHQIEAVLNDAALSPGEALRQIRELIR